MNSAPHLLPPLPPKAVLFDLDDTLWPIAPVIARAETVLYDWLLAHAPLVAQRYTVEQLRQRRLALHAADPARFLDPGALRRTALLEVFAETGEDPLKVEAAMAFYQVARNAVTPYDDVVPGLLRLGDKFLVGSISNGNADLEVIGLARHFKVSLAAGIFGRAKPAIEIFHAACEALGVSPREAVYVGDDLQLDVVAAQKAGMRAVWLNRAGGDGHLAAGVTPDAICASLDQLLLWLEQQLELPA